MFKFFDNKHVTYAPIVPDANGTRALGGASLRWSTVYGAAGDYSGTVTANLFSGSGASLTALPAASLTGTIADARFPATLPVASGVNLTALNATNLASGTVPDARFPATLPVASGVNLTALNATNLASGNLAYARLPNASGTWDSGGQLSFTRVIEPLAGVNIPKGQKMYWSNGASSAIWAADTPAHEPFEDNVMTFRADNGPWTWLSVATGLVSMRLSNAGALKVLTTFACNGKTPGAAQAYTVTNPTTSRSFDASTATAAQVAAALGTLLKDLTTIGLVTGVT